MQVDLLFDSFSASWAEIRPAVMAADQADYGAAWVFDHMSGAVHGESHVLEAWTLLSAIAAITQRIAIGPLVLNAANREAGVLAQMAATLQEVSAGRLLLGLGAGAGPSSPYAAEDVALGREVKSAQERRARLREYIADIRSFWRGDNGFLAPRKAPPIIVGASGPKMAHLAGECADGVNLQADRMPKNYAELAAISRGASSRPGFLVTVYAAFETSWLDPGSDQRQYAADVGVDRLILRLRPPYLQLLSG